MELEDLKQQWQVLNKRLEENEILNKKIILDMIKKRTTSAYNKLMNMELVNLMIMIVLIPTFLITLCTAKYLPTHAWLIFLGLFILLVTIWEVIKVIWLKKFDIEKKNIQQLALLINTYRKWILMECAIIAPFVVIILGTLFFSIHTYNLPWLKILLLSLIVILPIFIAIMYRFFYKKHFNNIQKSLDELKEFKE